MIVTFDLSPYFDNHYRKIEISSLNYGSVQNVHDEIFNALLPIVVAHGLFTSFSKQVEGNRILESLATSIVVEFIANLGVTGLRGTNVTNIRAAEAAHSNQMDSRNGSRRTACKSLLDILPKTTTKRLIDECALALDDLYQHYVWPITCGHKYVVYTVDCIDERNNLYIVDLFTFEDTNGLRHEDINLSTPELYSTGHRNNVHHLSKGYKRHAGLGVL
jgi:hypothetical protein